MERIARIAADHGFTVLSSEDLPEIDGRAYVMCHEASKAKLVYLRNDDANKAFSISFKTPAADDTGVFHILEHSVLCGSRKFPVKEPFVNLLKTSMQTFLNAMTFPDKTMYPVASTNEQDLLNLMDVYLDAVFYPAIYQKRTVFEQEGWHYELAGAGGLEGALRAEADAQGGCARELAADQAGVAGTGAAGAEAACAQSAADAQGGRARELVYNGVVYNEMKGALSEPDSVLYDTLAAALFPDTTYRFESGGTPEAIPTLTYESYLDTHARHYRPDNSYIILYGNMDLDVFLRFIDEEYLSPLSRVERPALDVNPLEEQAPVVNLGVKKPMATAPENACAAVGYVVGHVRDRERLIAADILLDAIMGSNEAPMKRALLDAGIASDASAYLADGVLQPFAVVQLRGVRAGGGERLRELVEQQARILSDGGLDHELVQAALSHAEFVMREHNFGCADGVALAMSCMAGWLYDDDLPTAYLRYEDAFADLRAKVDRGYFEQLMRELFLENGHYAEAEVVPVPACDDAAVRERLAAVSAAMTPDDFARVEQEVAVLRAAQEAPDAPSDVAKLPQLSVADIGEAPSEGAFGLMEGTSVPCIRHQVPTRGIVYAYRYFDMSCLAFEELPYATVLAMVLGKLDTAHRSASDLDKLVQGKLGDLSFFADVDEDVEDRDAFSVKLVVGTSALAENVEYAASVAREVMLETDFTDRAKICDILMQKRVSMEQACAAAGHSAAMSRVASYYLPAAVVREQLGGMDFYFFLRDLTDNYAERAEALGAKLAELAQRLFSDAGCVLSFAGSDEDLERFLRAGGVLGSHAEGAAGESADAHAEGAVAAGESAAATHAEGAATVVASASPAALVVPEPCDKHEAFVVPSDVSYTALGFDRRLLGEPYSGAWLVASRALSYDYLWNEVRVKGGAYGAGFQATRPGSMRFYSYRDPHIDQTLSRFGGAGAWVAAFNPSEAEMEGFVVSTVAGLDAPQKARNLIRRQDGMFFSGYTPEQRAQVREQVIAAAPDHVRALGAALDRAVDQRLVCTFGSREIIEKSSEGFTVVDMLGE